jgi:hypothetical protein
MSAEELMLIVSKARKVQELQRARARVKQLERELRGEPIKTEEPPYIPSFLQSSHSTGESRGSVPRANREA